MVHVHVHTACRIPRATSFLRMQLHGSLGHATATVSAGDDVRVSVITTLTDVVF